MPEKTQHRTATPGSGRLTHHPARRATRGRRRLALALTPALLVVGCAQTAQEAAPAVPEAPAAEMRADFPMSLTSCGTTSLLEGPAERIVAVKSTAIEMVLALGAGDRLVGTGFADGPVPPEHAATMDQVPVLAERLPSSEVVLETEPDLVYAGWESTFSAEGVGERDTLADLGVATYVSPAACKDPEHQPDRLTFDHVVDEITQVAAALGVPEAGEELAAAQRAELDAVVPDDRGLTALWYSSGTDVPYVGAGTGAPQLLMDTVGLTNVAADIQDTWSSYGWEDVVAHDPDVIVLVDSSWNSAEQKRELLASHPATANLTAVRHERYLVVPFVATEAGVRTSAAAVELAAQLAELDT